MAELTNNQKFWKLTGLTHYNIEELATDKTAEEKKVIGKKLFWMIKAGVILTGDAEKNQNKKLFEEVATFISSTYGVEKPSTINDIEIEPTTSKKAGDKLTAEEANSYNATLTGAKHAGDEKTPAVTYTAEEVEAHNGELDIWDEETIKTPATYYEASDEEVINGNKQVGDEKTPAVTYTAEEIEAHNGELDIWDEETIKTPATTYSQEEANEANSQLTGALQPNVALTEEQATAYNAAIS